MRTFARIRPDTCDINSDLPRVSYKILTDSRGQGETLELVTAQEHGHVVGSRGTMRYKFSRVLPEDTTEEELFQAAAKDAVFACLRGVSATILFLQWGYYDDARMVTGSKDGSGQTWAVSVIRSLFGEMGKTGSRACLEHQKIRVSSVKVVGDRVYDLLGAIEADGRPETRAEGLWVDGTNCGNGATSRAQAIGVSNEEETLSALHRVNSRQFAGKAALPRGHTVFSISIPFEGTSTITDQAGAAPLETITRCELNLVHLANGEGAHECDDPGRLPGVPGGGSSPRSGETRAGVADATEASPRTPGAPVSVHAREGGNVDRSLGALERVLGTLQHPGSAIPYRDSPLTLVLRDSLSVGSQVALAVDLSLRVRHLPETVSMFRFIERCSGVQQVGVTGEDLAAVEQMTLLREENAGMRASLQAYEAILQDLTRQIEDRDKGTKKTAGRLEATDTTGASKELSHVGEEAFAALTKALVNGSDEASEKLETLDRRSLQKCCRELCTLAQRPGHSSPSSAGSREEAEGEDAEGGDDVEDLVFFRALPTPSPAGHSVGRAARGAPCSGGIGRDEQRDSCGRESQDHGQLSSTGEVELGYGTCGSDAITPRAEGVTPRPRTANVQAGRLAERRLSSGLTKKGKSVRAFGNVAMSPMRKSTFLLEQESSELKRASILPAKGSRRQQHVHDHMGSHGDIIFDAVTPATDTLTASFLSPFGSESTAGAILLSDDEKEDDQESDGDEATVGSTMRRGAGEGYSGQQSLQGEEGMPSEQTARRPPPLLSILNDESDFDTVGKGRRCKSVASATSEDRLCALLTEGGFFIKHSKFGKPHVRFVWMSWDLSRIMWRRCGKEAVRKSARTTSFDAVYVGATERDPAASGVTFSATSTMSRGLFLPTRPRTSGNAEKQIVLSGANGRQQLVLEVDGGRLPPEKEIEQRDQWLQAFRFAVQRANRDVASKMVRTQEYRRSKSANNLESKDGEGLTPTLSASGRTSLPFEASLKLKHDLDVSHSSSGGSLGWGDVASMSGSETISPSPAVNSRGGSGAFATSGSKNMIRPLPSAMKSIKDERDSEHRISSKTATVSPPSTSTKRVSWGMQDLISPSSGPLSALTSPGDPQSQRGHAASPPPSLLSSSSASEAHLSPSSHDGSDVPLHAAGDPEQRRVRRSNTPRRPRQGVFNFQSKPGAQMDTSHHEPDLEFFPIPSEDDSASEQGTKDDVPAAGGEDDQEAVNSVAHADGSTTSASALPADENSSDSSLMHLSSRSPCDGDGKEGSSHRLASQTNPRRWWNLTPRVKTAAGRSSSGNFGSAGSPVGSSGDTVQQLQPSSPSRLGRAASARDAQSSCSSDGPTEGSERDVAQPPSSQGSPTSSDSRGSSSSSAATHVMG